MSLAWSYEAVMTNLRRLAPISRHIKHLGQYPSNFLKDIYTANLSGLKRLFSVFVVFTTEFGSLRTYIALLIELTDQSVMQLRQKNSFEKVNLVYNYTRI